LSFIPVGVLRIFAAPFLLVGAVSVPPEGSLSHLPATKQKKKKKKTRKKEEKKYYRHVHKKEPKTWSCR
jgi:hypothetical protein